MNYKFNAQQALDDCIDWLKTQGEAAKFNQVVIGISGGKDSTIAAALCCRAFGSENVHGLLLPNGVQPDIEDSIAVCKALGISYDTINIKAVYDSFILSYGLGCMGTSGGKKIKEKDISNADKLEMILKKANDTEKPLLTDDATINLSPRIRMTMLRLWGQSHHHRLCGTGNLSEITVGYFTKDGDSCCDFNPLGGLTSVEVVEIGKLLKEIPKKYVIKTPSDGLCGMTDEEKLGVTYEEIHKYIRSITMDKDTWYKINDLEKRGVHKRRGSSTPTFLPSDNVLHGV